MMDNDNMRTALVRISELARDSHSSEFAETLLRVQGLAESAINQLPPAPVAEELSSEPVEYQFQDNDGRWHPFMNEKHRRNTEAAGYRIRALYTHSQPAVPEGFDIRRNSNGDIVVTRLSDMGAAAYSKGSPIVTEAMGWLFIDALLTATPVKPAVPDVDALAQHIRKIDGNNDMGAGALAESICNWIEEQNNDQ